MNPNQPLDEPTRTQAGNSVTVGLWTLVSRITGFLRVAVIAAVLGPTALGNAFLAVDVLPTLLLQFLAGSLISSLLVPALVPSIDAGDRPAAARIAGGFAGAVLAITIGVTVVALALSPLVAELLTIGVDSPAAADEQEDAAQTLLLLVLPQLPLYAMALIGGATMNAHGRFALAAAAPVAENVGVMAVLLGVAIAYGTGGDLGSDGDGHLVLLGLGTTGAVALHAGLMVWGAHRTGVRLVPRAGWRDPRVLSLLRGLAASMGQTGARAGQFFVLLLVANTVPAGVVALRLATNFLWLPVQVGARPVALTMLPALARLHAADDRQEFRDQCALGLARVCFLALPAAAGYFVLADTLAQAVSYGELDDTAGIDLVAACLAGMALAVIGESSFQMLTHAAYARGDVRSPLVATAAGTIASLAVLPWALLADGELALLLVGLTASAGSAVSVWLLHRRLTARLPPPRHPATTAIARAFAAAAIMAVPVFAVERVLPGAPDGPGEALLTATLAGAAGVAVFVAVQAAWRSAELTFFATGLRIRRPDPRGSAP